MNTHSNTHRETHSKTFAQTVKHSQTHTPKHRKTHTNTHWNTLKHTKTHPNTQIRSGASEFRHGCRVVSDVGGGSFDWVSQTRAAMEWYLYMASVVVVAGRWQVDMDSDEMVRVMGEGYLGQLFGDDPTLYLCPWTSTDMEVWSQIYPKSYHFVQ